jgi:hypothetical protein
MIITGSPAGPIQPGWSLAEIVADLNASGYNGAAFQSWYEASVKKDPGLTPYDGVVVWIGDEAIGGALSAGTAGTSQAVAEAGTGAAIGGAQAAKALNGLNPFKWVLGFGNTTGLLTRILKVAFGGILLVAGVLKLSGANKTLEQVVPLVGGPAGKLLAA